MKKLDLNKKITDLSGATLSIAALQLRLSPGSTVTREQRETPAILSSVALTGLESLRGPSVSDDTVLLAYSTQKKIYSSLENGSIVELEDSEFALVNSIFQNQTTSIRGQFLEMINSLNQTIDDKISD